jgi:pilus assembly protein CpaD
VIRLEKPVMTILASNFPVQAATARHVMVRILAGSVMALSLAACKHEPGNTAVAGWALVDGPQRHPILVSQQPETLNVQVPRGSHGLSPGQRADLVAFARSSRAADVGNSRLVIAAPSGSANETTAITAVREIGGLLQAEGIVDTDIAVEPYMAEGAASPPIKVSFLRYVAEGPECGVWPTNLAHEPKNLPMANFGCANQKNLAAMISNPADLVSPRTMTPRPAERRLVTWEKYVKGEVTSARKDDDERIKTTKE